MSSHTCPPVLSREHGFYDNGRYSDFEIFTLMLLERKDPGALLSTVVTLDRLIPNAVSVTKPAQQTKALELERPELGGIFPSTRQFIPVRSLRPKCS